jgi:DNA-directed RNA polymerase specialized sigma24 family protein
MNETSGVISMTEQNRQISQVVTEQRSRLRNFIRKRVPNEADVEDILQMSSTNCSKPIAC